MQKLELGGWWLQRRPSTLAGTIDCSTARPLELQDQGNNRIMHDRCYMYVL